MKKLMMVAGMASLGALITGCCTDNGNAVKEWQQNRFMAQQINAVYDAKRPLEVTDVIYKSVQEPKFAVLGAPFNLLAPVPAGLYFKVVQGVDALDAELSGIELVREFNQKTGKDADPKMTPEEVFAEWAEKGKDDPTFATAKVRYEKCVQAIKNSKTDAIIPIIEDIINVQIPKAMEDVQKTLAQVKADIDAGKIKLDATGLELLGALKVMAQDAGALGSQLGDTLVGAKHWLSLAIEARDMRKAFEEMDKIK